jgi:hypothetical protein
MLYSLVQNITNGNFKRWLGKGIIKYISWLNVSYFWWLMEKKYILTSFMYSNLTPMFNTCCSAEHQRPTDKKLATLEATLY